MKVLQINIFGNLSTGKIAVEIHRTLVSHGHSSMVAFARNTIADDVPYIKIGNKANICLDGILTRITDRAGLYSTYATQKLIRQIEEYNPDIIHLHNIHGYYINYELLFRYFKDCNKPIVWTLHDCWAYTGHCCYYSMAQCNRWISGCYQCPQKHAYPRSVFWDNSQKNYIRKKRLFSILPNLHLVTVSSWLNAEVKKSFLANLPCITIYNGIDTKVFRPLSSDFRKKNKIEEKFVILGVASTWDKRKGLEDFIALQQYLDERFQIVLIGITKKQQKFLPKKIISLERTDSIDEMAALYTTADVYFNASMEETFGLPTVESMACGTPVIVYNTTALPELVEAHSGAIVKERDILAVYKKIIEMYEGQEQYCCTDVSRFEKQVMCEEYLQLYEKIYRKYR